jgi:hypothetical protein
LNEEILYTLCKINEIEINLIVEKIETSVNSLISPGSHSFNVISTVGEVSLFNLISIILNAAYGRIRTSCSPSNDDIC